MELRDGLITKLASYFNFFYSHTSTDAENMQVTTAVSQVHLNQELSTITGLWWHHSWRTQQPMLKNRFFFLAENVSLKSLFCSWGYFFFLLLIYITVQHIDKFGKHSKTKNEQLPQSHITLKGHIQMDLMVRDGRSVLRPDQEVSHPSPTTTYDRLRFPRDSSNGTGGENQSQRLVEMTAEMTATQDAHLSWTTTCNIH